MHVANNIFCKYVSKEFSDFFNEDIIEFGSFNVNGTIRDYFKNCKRYIGVDWRNGLCVDVVGLAHEVRFDLKAKAILSASMLEHDPYWQKSLDNMINHLKPDGILVLTWGVAKNGEHCLKEAPDGKFYCLKAEKVINHLTSRNLKIYISVYDCELCNLIKDVKDLNRLKKLYIDEKNKWKSDGFGEFNLVAFNSSFADKLEGGFITELQDEDRIVMK